MRNKTTLLRRSEGLFENAQSRGDLLLDRCSIFLKRFDSPEDNAVLRALRRRIDIPSRDDVRRWIVLAQFESMLDLTAVFLSTRLFSWSEQKKIGGDSDTIGDADRASRRRRQRMIRRLKRRKPGARD